MRIILDTDKLEHIKEKSGYNHNYYKLNYSIDNCEIVYEEWEDDSFEGNYWFGNFNDSGEFEAKHLFYGDMDGNIDLLSNKQDIY